MKNSFPGLICLLLFFSVFLLFGCSNNSGPESDQGIIEVITITEGENTDGYDIQIRGEQRTHVSANDTLMSNELNEGTYEVELLELPEKCSLVGVNPVSVTLENGEEYTVTFEVNCTEMTTKTGTLEVISKTSPPDANYTYRLKINSSEEYDIAANDTLVFRNQLMGSYSLELDDLPENCSVEGENPLTIQLQNEEKVTATLKINCDLRSSLEVFTNTSLINSEEVYSFHINGEQYEIGANDELIIYNLEPGTYQVSLSQIPSSCVLRGGQEQEITIVTEYSVSVSFGIFCQTIFDYKWIYPTVSNIEGQSIDVLYPDGRTDVISPILDFAGRVKESPEKTKLAYTGSSYQQLSWGYELFVSDPDGSNLVQLTHQPDDPHIESFSWSPDGKKLAFSAKVINGVSNIYTINIDGSELTQITKNQKTSDHAPLWVQNESKFVFHRAEFVDSRTNDLFIMNSDGSNLKNITNTPNILERDLLWTPSGLKIRYMTEEGGFYNFYTSNPDGSDRELILQLEGENKGGFSWSPDGSKIAYSQTFYGSDEDLPPEIDSGSDIYVINADDGSNPVKLTHTEKLGYRNSVQSWSPDGNYIIFNQYPWGTDAIFIYTMNADGTEINHIGYDGCCFIWSPLD